MTHSPSFSIPGVDFAHREWRGVVFSRYPLQHLHKPAIGGLVPGIAGGWEMCEVLMRVFRQEFLFLWSS